MSVDVTCPLRPRHRRSPRARRRVAEIGLSRTGIFAVAEIEVDLTGRGGDIAAHVAKAAVEAMPRGPVHLGVGSGVILDADELSLAGLRRRMGAPGPGSAAATFRLAVSGLSAEVLPPEPGQAGTLTLGATVDRPAVVRFSGGDPAIAIRSFTRLTLAYDPRALDRADATRILTTVKQRLETS
jgi:hypothetical protein